ncbi:MAG: hypothetical protein BWY63_03907 [Chloroflexi bacterium ADurb.Bin360]|nr:MAG: hypothetical protein BWY63_03907 [Chloroflexi bacterium ADurb.Bin360]
MQRLRDFGGQVHFCQQLRCGQGTTAQHIQHRLNDVQLHGRDIHQELAHKPRIPHRHKVRIRLQRAAQQRRDAGAVAFVEGVRVGSAHGGVVSGIQRVPAREFRREIALTALIQGDRDHRERLMFGIVTAAQSDHRPRKVSQVGKHHPLPNLIVLSRAVNPPARE